MKAGSACKPRTNLYLARKKHEVMKNRINSITDNHSSNSLPGTSLPKRYWIVITFLLLGTCAGTLWVVNSRSSPATLAKPGHEAVIGRPLHLRSPRRSNETLEMVAAGEDPRSALISPAPNSGVSRDMVRRATKGYWAKRVTNEQSDAEPQHLQAKRDRIAKYPLLVWRLESLLIDVKERSTGEGIQPALTFLKDSGVKVQEGKVTVVAECEQTADPNDVAALMAVRNATIIRTGDAHVKASVPFTALEDIACNIPGVSFVRTPIQKRLLNVVTTEGREATAVISVPSSSPVLIPTMTGCRMTGNSPTG